MNGHFSACGIRRIKYAPGFVGWETDLKKDKIDDLVSSEGYFCLKKTILTPLVNILIANETKIPIDANVKKIRNF